MNPRVQEKILYKEELNGINRQGNDLKVQVDIRLNVGENDLYKKVKLLGLTAYC